MMRSVGQWFLKPYAKASYRNARSVANGDAKRALSNLQFLIDQCITGLMNLSQ